VSCLRFLRFFVRDKVLAGGTSTQRMVCVVLLSTWRGTNSRP
jgi:hypothetical protein